MLKSDELKIMEYEWEKGPNPVCMIYMYWMRVLDEENATIE
jgi:hypothetical protein